MCVYINKGSMNVLIIFLVCFLMKDLKNKCSIRGKKNPLI